MSENIQDLKQPHHCFCQIPAEELRYWATLRYIEKRPTIELLEQAQTLHDKEVVSIVAMLDLDEKTMLELMGDVDLPEHHIIQCREHVRKMVLGG